MICSKCGAQNDTNNSFCQKCGEVLKENNSMDNEKKSDKLGVTSLVLGIISIITSIFFVLSITTGVTGLIIGIKSKIKSGFRKAGIILNTIGLILTFIIIVSVIVMVIIFARTKEIPGDDIDDEIYYEIDNEIYYGDGYNLEYDKNWSITTLAAGQEALQYKNEESFLAPIGSSALSDAEVDFDTYSGKRELYNSFYDYWDDNGNNLRVFSGSNGFSNLTNDIEYATYNYGTSYNNIKGKYILLVSTEKNIVLSFITNASENVEDNDNRAIKLLENIEIYKRFPTTEDDEEVELNNNVIYNNEIYDNDLYNSLDSMTNWNMYYNVRTGDLGKVKNINGGWRSLSESETYWKFENGQFWWYKSINDLNDNYWYGTTQILTGKEGLSLAGIDENKLDTIVSNSSGNVTPNDVYTIVFTPNKVISGGLDKSSTNITPGETWTYIYILVDHGVEGIEAQVLNLQTYDTSYYVKISD